MTTPTTTEPKKKSRLLAGIALAIVVTIAITCGVCGRSCSSSYIDNMPINRTN